MSYSNLSYAGRFRQANVVNACGKQKFTVVRRTHRLPTATVDALGGVIFFFFFLLMGAPELMARSIFLVSTVSRLDGPTASLPPPPPPGCNF